MRVTAGSRSGGGDVLLGHLAAVFLVRMPVRGVHRLLERDTPLPRKGQRIRAARDNFIAGQQAAGHLGKALILRADDDRRFHEGVLQFVVLHIDEAPRGIALQGLARDGHHALTAAGHDGKLRAHAGAQQRLRIRHVKSGFERIGCRVGGGAEMSEVCLENTIRKGRDADVRLLAGPEFADEMLGHRRHGVDLAEVHDFHERILLLDRRAGHHIHHGDHPGEWREQPHARRRIARLPALQHEHLGVFRDGPVNMRRNRDHPTGHAAADHRAMPRCHADPPERKDRFLKHRLLRSHNFEPEIGHAFRGEDDGIGEAFLLRFGKTGDRDKSEEQDKQGGVFHRRHLVFRSGRIVPAAAAWRVRARW